MGEDRSHRDQTLNPRRWPRGSARVEVSPHRLETKQVSQLSGEERDLLYHLALKGLPGDLANLGHSKGGSAILFAKAIIARNGSGMVYSVDLFESAKKWRDARQTLVDYGVRQIVHPCRGYTKEWGEKFKQEGKRFVGMFIDADHTYAHVKEDFLMWSPLLLSGGWVAFHDTHQEFSHQAIADSVEKDSGFKEDHALHVDTIRVFRKR